MKRLSHFILIFVAFLFVAADKKDEKATPSDAQIQQWIKQLGDDDFKVREEATRDLLKAGIVAFDAVTKATKSEDPEVKQRALRIMQMGKLLEKVAIAYFKKLGDEVKVDEESTGKSVIGLNLKNSEVTDAGLVHLKRLSKLQKLYLPFTKVTDAGLVHLKGLTSLRELDLRGTKVTDAGLVHLKGLTSLQGLYLGGTKITDAGLIHLKGLTKLQRLNLGFIKVTDAGLVHLKGLRNLRRLYLQSTQVTDAGLVHLKGIRGLRELWLAETKVTQAGIEKLKKALRICHIIWSGE